MKTNTHSIADRVPGTAATLVSPSGPVRLIAAAIALMLLASWPASGVSRPAPAPMLMDGSYRADFSGHVALWDISGTYYETLADEIEMEYTIYQDADGHFTGGGNFGFSVYGFYMDGDIGIAGKVTGTGPSTRITMRLSLVGGGSRDEATVSVKATANVRAQINRAMREMIGRMQVRVCAAGSNGVQSVRRCASQGQSFRAAISDSSMDGSFSVLVNVQTTGAAITGTGQVTLSNGEAFHYTVTGNFNTRRNMSSLRLTPGEGSGHKPVRLINIRTQDRVLASGVLNGSVAGQRIASRKLQP